MNEKITFDFSDANENFVRKAFNTNPQLASAAGTFYAAESAKAYWLGESYEQKVRDANLESAAALGIILQLQIPQHTPQLGRRLKGCTSRSVHWLGYRSRSRGVAADFDGQSQRKLFRLIGRGHGEWLNRNAKVSIEKIRASSTTCDYGSFSVVIRSLGDTDNKVQVLERFDNLNLTQQVLTLFLVNWGYLPRMERVRKTEILRRLYQSV